MSKTVVLFRRFRSKPHDVIALFPEVPGWNEGMMDSFMHEGQHGSASVNVIGWTKPAKPGEYESLLRELTSEPFNYDLDIRKRTPRGADGKRRKAVRNG